MDSELRFDVAAIMVNYGVLIQFGDFKEVLDACGHNDLDDTTLLEAYDEMINADIQITITGQTFNF